MTDDGTHITSARAGTSTVLAGAGDINGLSLLDGGDGSVYLLSSAEDDAGPRVIRVHALTEAEVTQVAVHTPPQIFPPEWAAVMLPDHSLSVALTRPGGASCPLVHWACREREITPMSRTDLSRVLRSPRAARRTSGPPSFVAVEARAYESLIVHFAPEPRGGWSERILHKPSAHRVTPAILIGLGAGWLLLYHQEVDARMDESVRVRPHPGLGQVSLGLVHGLRLDASFNPTASPFVVPTDGPVYEFDADALSDRLVLIGTTPRGYRVTEARLTPDGVADASHREASATTTAATGAPAVMLHGDDTHIALVEALGTPMAAVHYERRAPCSTTG